MGNSVHDFVGRSFNMKRIKELVEKELYHDYGSESCVYLFDMVSGSYGNLQQKYIAEYFEIRLDPDGIADSHSFISDVENYLTESIGLDGDFFFGYLEADNTYGLFYNRE